MEENKEHKENEKKTGFTVSELEGTAKKYASEIGLGVIFAMTAIFTLIWGGAMMVWSVILSMILAIIGALVPGSMMAGISKALDYVYRERVMLIITGVVLLVVAIFIPVLIFALVGLIAGGSLSLSMKKKACKACCKTDKADSNKDDNSSS
jgi:ABC-type multidrug transport system fused ATPase/permease subunit